MIEYVNGIAMPERDGYCSCGCEEKHNHETYKLWGDRIYWFKHGAYPSTQSHVGAWLEKRTQKVLL